MLYFRRHVHYNIDVTVNNIKMPWHVLYGHNFSLNMCEAINVSKISFLHKFPSKPEKGSRFREAATMSPVLIASDTWEHCCVAASLGILAFLIFYSPISEEYNSEFITCPAEIVSASILKVNVVMWATEVESQSALTLQMRWRVKLLLGWNV